MLLVRLLSGGGPSPKPLLPADAASEASEARLLRKGGPVEGVLSAGCGAARDGATKAGGSMKKGDSPMTRSGRHGSAAAISWSGTLSGDEGGLSVTATLGLLLPARSGEGGGGQVVTSLTYTAAAALGEMWGAMAMPEQATGPSRALGLSECGAQVGVSRAQ